MSLNRYRRKRPKVDASIFDSVLSHTRRSDVSEKKKKILASIFERFRLWTSLESSPVSVKLRKTLKRIKKIFQTLLFDLYTIFTSIGGLRGNDNFDEDATWVFNEFGVDTEKLIGMANNFLENDNILNIANYLNEKFVTDNGINWSMAYAAVVNAKL